MTYRVRYGDDYEDFEVDEFVVRDNGYLELLVGGRVVGLFASGQWICIEERS